METTRSEDAGARGQISIRLSEFDPATDTIEIGFTPAEGKAAGAMFTLKVPAEDAFDPWMFVEFCRPKFAARQVVFDQAALEAEWERHEPKFANIERARRERELIDIEESDGIVALKDIYIDRVRAKLGPERSTIVNFAAKDLVRLILDLEFPRIDGGHVRVAELT
jgi:hypothetical protein